MNTSNLDPDLNTITNAYSDFSAEKRDHKPNEAISLIPQHEASAIDILTGSHKLKPLDGEIGISY